MFLTTNQLYSSPPSVRLCQVPGQQQVDCTRAAEPAGAQKSKAAGEIRQPARGWLHPVLGLWDLASGFLQ